MHYLETAILFPSERLPIFDVSTTFKIPCRRRTGKLNTYV